MSDLADRGVGIADPAAGQVSPGTTAARGMTHRNYYIHYLRGAAALFVVLYHCSEYLGAMKGDRSFLSVFSGFFGGYGVAIFFAISGYLIAEVLRRDTPARFIVGRVARIYPLMLIAVALFSVAFLAIGKPRGLNGLSLTLVPTGPRGYFLGVEWTLLYEMTYYVVLALVGFVGLARYRTKLVLLWLALLCLAYALGAPRDVQALAVLSDIPFSIVNISFILGYLASEAQRKGWLHPILIAPALLFALAAAIGPADHFRLLTGVSASLLIAAAVSAQSIGHGGWLGRVGSRLGDASYALYLCHVPVILILGALLSETVPTPILWSLWLAVSIGIAMLLGPLDVSLHRRLRRLIDAAPARRLTAFALVFVGAFLAIAAYAEREVRADLASLAQAKQALATPTVSQAGAIRADIDSVERLPDGAWVVRGYAVDLARPDMALYFAVEQKGQVAAIVGMRRVRPDMARIMERPDLKGLRFGFMLRLPDGFDCSDGALAAAVAAEDGRVVRLPSDQLAAICAR